MKKILKFAFASSIFLVCFCFLSLSVSHADIYTGGRSSGIKYAYYDSSVSNRNYNSKFNAGRAMWDGISSNVSVGFDPLSYNTNDKYYVGSSSTSGLLGLTRPYKLNQNGIIVTATANDTWAYATVSVYETNINNFPLKNDAEIISTVIAHEIGHTLSLGHSAPQYYSIMQQNQAITTYPPTSYDRSELIRKWGP